MAYNGSGQYTTTNPPPFIYDTTISETEVNAALADIAAALSLALVRDGQAAMTGDLDMGSQSIKNIESGTVSTPSIGFAAGGGFFSPAANQVALEVSGVAKLTAKATGLEASGTDQTTSNVDTAVGTSLNITSPGVASGSGGILTFSAADAAWNFAAIKGFIVDASDNSLGYLDFATRKVSTDATLTNQYRLDNLGRLLNVANSQPSFRAVGGSLTSTTPIICGTESHDFSASYNPSTGVFTAPVAGVYYFQAVVSLATFGGNTWGPGILYLRKNGSTSGAAAAYYFVTANGVLSVSLLDNILLAANDTIDLYTTGGDTNHQVNLAIFCGRLVG